MCTKEMVDGQAIWKHSKEKTHPPYPKLEWTRIKAQEAYREFREAQAQKEEKAIFFIDKVQTPCQRYVPKLDSWPNTFQLSQTFDRWQQENATRRNFLRIS